jgi:hypothetical protein
MSSHKPLDIIWHAKNMALLIGRSKRQVEHMLKKGQLTGAFKKGRYWCISYTDLMKNFSGSLAPVASVDAKLFVEFNTLMQSLSPKELEGVLLRWT